ncbi:MAG: DUF1850 domain-containing protein [Thermodesulfobacteriota bacterium]
MIIKKGPLLIGIIIGVALMGILLWAFWPAYRLEVSSLGRSKASLSFPVSSGDRFSIWFLHSYDRAFFQENYQIDGHHHILLRDMTFQSHLNGAGFFYPNFHLRADGVGELREINEQRERVEFMMGSRDLANHTLIWRREKIELSNYFEAGEIITIRVVERTGWKKVLLFINKTGERRQTS